MRLVPRRSSYAYVDSSSWELGVALALPWRTRKTTTPQVKHFAVGTENATHRSVTARRRWSFRPRTTSRKIRRCSSTSASRGRKPAKRKRDRRRLSRLSKGEARRTKDDHADVEARITSHRDEETEARGRIRDGRQGRGRRLDGPWRPAHAHLAAPTPPAARRSPTLRARATRRRRRQHRSARARPRCRAPSPRRRRPQPRPSRMAPTTRRRQRLHRLSNSVSSTTGRRASCASQRGLASRPRSRCSPPARSWASPRSRAPTRSTAGSTSSTRAVSPRSTTPGAHSDFQLAQERRPPLQRPGHRLLHGGGGAAVDRDDDALHRRLAQPERRRRRSRPRLRCARFLAPVLAPGQRRPHAARGVSDANAFLARVRRSHRSRARAGWLLQLQRAGLLVLLRHRHRARPSARTTTSAVPTATVTRSARPRPAASATPPSRPTCPR